MNFSLYKNTKSFSYISILDLFIEFTLPIFVCINSDDASKPFANAVNNKIHLLRNIISDQ